MPVNITDVDTFTDPIVAPADSDPADRTYVLTIAQGLANRTRNLANRVGGDDGTGEWVYEDGPRPRVPTRTTGGCGAWTYGSEMLLTSQSNGAVHFFPLDDVPEGAVITEINAMVTPGAARGAADRPELALYRSRAGLDWATEAAGTFDLVDSALHPDPGTTRRRMDLFVAYTVDRGASGEENPVIRLKAGNDGGGHFGDTLWALRVKFNDPGPRNF